MKQEIRDLHDRYRRWSLLDKMKRSSACVGAYRDANIQYNIYQVDKKALIVAHHEALQQHQRKLTPTELQDILGWVG